MDLGMKKILIVDDEPYVQEMLSDFLQMIGYETETAENGLVALEKFKKFQPDLAIVDLKMPVMNGVVFCEKLFLDHPDFPVLIITAFLHDYEPEALLKLGVREILTKPVDFDDLKKAIEKGLA